MTDCHLTCIHAERGLCPDCRVAWEEDALAYLEYGDHQDGIERFRALQAELLAEVATDRAPELRPVYDDSDIPF